MDEQAGTFNSVCVLTERDGKCKKSINMNGGVQKIQFFFLFTPYAMRTSYKMDDSASSSCFAEGIRCRKTIGKR